jgi:hypothetical protein
MERIPSTVVIHKRLDSLDTRFAKMNHDLVNNPLKQNLSFLYFGKYHKAADDADYAFVRVNEMWDKAPLDPDTSDGEDQDDANDLQPAPTKENMPDKTPGDQEPDEPAPRATRKRKQDHAPVTHQETTLHRHHHRPENTGPRTKSTLE